MTVYIIDPIRDPRWAEFISRHDAASVFHSQPWLEALQRTYGYTPVVYTTSPPSSPLSNGIVLCQVNSWLTGHRMVSVPFSDHCEPLLDSPSAAAAIVEELKKSVDVGNWKYVELRPHAQIVCCEWSCRLRPLLPPHARSRAQCQMSSLRRFTKTVYSSRSDERSVRNSSTKVATPHIYWTRSTVSWCRLAASTNCRRSRCTGLEIWLSAWVTGCRVRVAFKDGKEIASILTLQHRNVRRLQVRCSDPRLQNLGVLLSLVETITRGQGGGLSCLDFGRSDADNAGLIAFKDRWGAKSSRLTLSALVPKAASRSRQTPFVPMSSSGCSL